jgi:hypothetical protein
MVREGRPHDPGPEERQYHPLAPSLRAAMMANSADRTKPDRRIDPATPQGTVATGAAWDSVERLPEQCTG